MTIAAISILCGISLSGWLCMYRAYRDGREDGLRMGYMQAVVDLLHDLNDVEPEALRRLLDWYIAGGTRRMQAIISQINETGEDN